MKKKVNDPALKDGACIGRSLNLISIPVLKNRAFRAAVKSLVIAGNGTNCEMEMAYGCKLGGSDIVDIIHINELIYGDFKLDEYHILNFPGGFLDGDDLGSAMAGANRIKYAKVAGSNERLLDKIRKFINDEKLIIGICNGFQLLIKLGLLPGIGGEIVQTCTLTFNDSGRFEDRWVYLRINKDSKCIFTEGLEGLYLPVRHGEGKFIPKDEETLKMLYEKSLIALQYSDQEYKKPTMDYPQNPNGSIDAIAGICDESGRVFGMMPHPEAYLHYTNHPQWTRLKIKKEGMGVAIFRNAVNYIKNVTT